MKACRENESTWMYNFFQDKIRMGVANVGGFQSFQICLTLAWYTIYLVSKLNHSVLEHI